MALNLAFESLKTAGNAEGESDELLISFAKTCLVAVTAISRVLRIIRSVAAAGFFTFFAGGVPLPSLGL